MAGERIRDVVGTGLPLRGDDIDTDRIIPARFLKSVSFDGLEQHLFEDDRRQADAAGLVHPVSNASFAGAAIMVVQTNFGCGSSREHAVWALADYGFRAVIASSFADIFSNNCVKNGVLTVILTEEQAAAIAQKASEVPNYELTIDLEARTVRDSHGLSATFPMDDFVRHCLLEGLDDIGLTLQHESDIAKYETSHPAPAAWRA